MITSNMSLSKVAAAARKDVGQVHRHVAEKHADLWSLTTVHDKEPIVRGGKFTSSKRLQWVYAASAFRGQVRLYPMVWYVSTEGVHALQIDAEGPASYFQPHVWEQYIGRFLKCGDLFDAMRRFIDREHERALFQHPYKGNPEGYVSLVEDGYIAGEYLKDDAIVHFRTFYDREAGHRKFGHLRNSLAWRMCVGKLTLERTSRRETPHTGWCRGYELHLDQRRRAA